jgi:phosphatidylserine/phosphatidylglycerophosphate/cardiolipin synthase-like enzyme
VKLLIQPDGGIKPILLGLNRAKKNIRILIFRFDRVEIEKALVAAVQRGVSVQVLIAYTNRGEEKNLRRLEMRLLAEGVTVCRTADDLVRYHGKMIVVDDRELYVFGFNFTHMDVDLSRSFGLQTTKSSVVTEAVRLFDSDCKRTPYKGAKGDLVVSPVNAREKLTKFVDGAKKRLLIYEMKISDRDFIKCLDKKIAAGVDIKILSRTAANTRTVPVRRLSGRLHLRAIIRDGDEAFIGSQSLRKLELEARREIGIIFHSRSIVKQMESVFEKDWKKSEPLVEADSVAAALRIPAKKVAKEVAKQIAVKPVVEDAVDRIVENSDAALEPEEIAQTVRDAFRDEVEGAVVNALRNLATTVADENKGPAPRGGHDEN